MPQPASQSNSAVPPLPPGYNLDQGSDGTPPLPEGYTLDRPDFATPPSAASRFAGSFARGMGVVSPEEGKNFFTHPIDTLKGMGEAQADLGRRTGSEFKSGDYLGAATHGVEYLLPGLGPTLAHAGDQLESGDTAGGIGTTLGAGATMAAGTPEARGIARGAISKAMQPALNTVGKAATSVGESLDPDLIGLVSPRAAHALRLTSKVGRVASKLGQRGAIAQQMTEATQGEEAPPAPAVAPESRLPAAFQPLPQKAPPVPGTADSPFQRGAIAQQMSAPTNAEPAPIAKPTPRPTSRGQLSKSMDEQLGKALGAKQLDPKVPLRGQLAARMPQEPDAGLPEGHTGVESSALRSYKYDPAAREFHAKATSGNTVYIYGDVSPEDAAAFEKATSKGQAWGAIRRNPLVAKIVDGKRMPTR